MSKHSNICKLMDMDEVDSLSFSNWTNKEKIDNISTDELLKKLKKTDDDYEVMNLYDTLNDENDILMDKLYNDLQIEMKIETKNHTEFEKIYLKVDKKIDDSRYNSNYGSTLVYNYDNNPFVMTSLPLHRSANCAIAMNNKLLSLFNDLRYLYKKNLCLAYNLVGLSNEKNNNSLIMSFENELNILKKYIEYY